MVNDPNVAGRVYVAVGGQGIFRSDNALGNSPDGSVIWTAVNTGLTSLATSVDVEMVSQSIAGATTLYAGVAANDGSLAIYTSTDGGNQWTPLAALPTSFDDGISGFAEKFNMVADPTTAGVVYLDGESGSIQGSPGILRYNPAGSGSWVEIDGSGTATGTAPHPDSRDMQFLGNNTLLESDDGGIYVLPSPANSTGNDWSSLNGNINDVELFSVSYDSTNNILFGGSQDNGSPVQSSPGNLLWKDLSSGDGQYTAVDTTSRPNGDVLRYVLSNNWSNLLRLEYDNANNLVSSTTVGLRAFPGAFNGSGLNNADLNFYFSGNFDFQPYVLNAVDPRLMLLGFFGVYEDADPSPANGDAGDVITDITAKVGHIRLRSLRWPTAASAPAPATPTSPWSARSAANVLSSRGETGSTFTEVDGTGAGQLGGTGALQSIAVDPSDWRAVYVVRSNSALVYAQHHQPGGQSFPSHRRRHRRQPRADHDRIDQRQCRPHREHVSAPGRRPGRRLPDAVAGKLVALWPGLAQCRRALDRLQPRSGRDRRGHIRPRRLDDQQCLRHAALDGAAAKLDGPDDPRHHQRSVRPDRPAHEFPRDLACQFELRNRLAFPSNRALRQLRI